MFLFWFPEEPRGHLGVVIPDLVQNLFPYICSINQRPLVYTTLYFNLLDGSLRENTVDLQRVGGCYF